MECWGRNDHGQSGRGTVSPYPAFYLTPQPVLGGATWAAVTSGWRHVCGLTKTGGVKCWGDNGDGQLGIGGTSSPGEPVPVHVRGLEGVPTAPVPMVEFYREELDHYFMTWVESEIGELDAGTTHRGWRRTGEAFMTFVAPQPDTLPVCRYYIPPRSARPTSMAADPPSATTSPKSSRTLCWSRPTSFMLSCLQVVPVP
jgi:hypothetical protein